MSAGGGYWCERKSGYPMKCHISKLVTALPYQIQPLLIIKLINMFSVLIEQLKTTTFNRSFFENAIRFVKCQVYTKSNALQRWSKIYLLIGISKISHKILRYIYQYIFICLTRWNSCIYNVETSFICYMFRSVIIKKFNTDRIWIIVFCWYIVNLNIMSNMSLIFVDLTCI